MGDAGHWLRFVLLAIVLVTAAITDWRTGRVPNRLTLPGALAGIALAAALGWSGGLSGMLQGAGHSAACMAIMVVCMAIAYFAGGIGGGDVKLMGAMAAILADWTALLSAAFYSVVIAAALAIGIMIHRGVARRTMHRLFGAMLSIVSRTQPNLPDDSPKVPFAAAACVGGLLAGAEYLLGLKLPWS